MKLTCDARELAESVAIAATIVPKQSARRVLVNLALVARDGVLEILATDLEVGLRVFVKKVDIETEGAVLVNANRAAQVLKELREARVEISADEGSGCIFVAEGCRFHVYGEDFGEYPEISRFGDPEGALSIPAEDFREMVHKTQFAAAIDQTRYAMNGILCQITESTLRFVATDGKRLAMIHRPMKGLATESISAVVPTKGMNMVTRLLMAGEEAIFLRFDETQALIKSECAEISARLVEGHFPPYEQVIPKNLSKELSLDAEEFASAIRKASLLTNRESQAVRFQFSKDKLEMLSRVADIGESRVVFPLSYDHEPVAIGFNPQFILDAIKVIDQDKVTFKFNDPKGATLLEEDNGLRYVVMPINLPADNDAA